MMLWLAPRIRTLVQKSIVLITRPWCLPALNPVGDFVMRDASVLQHCPPPRSG